MNLGFKDYFKAAFNGWLPVPLLGSLPINWLLLTGIGIGTILTALSVGFMGAAGVFLFSMGLDLTLVLSLSLSKAFRKFVDMQSLANIQEEITEENKTNLKQMLESLDLESRDKFQNLRRRCMDIVRMFNQLHPSAQNLETPQLSGLNQLLSTYYQLLISNFLIKRNVKPEAEESLNLEIGALERKLKKEKSERVRKSQQSRLDILIARKQRIAQLVEAQRFIESELNRIIDQVELIKADALTAKDPATFSQRVDRIHAEFQESSTWAKKQYQLLDEISSLDIDTPNLLEQEHN